jgi:hypothetical protein
VRGSAIADWCRGLVSLRDNHFNGIKQLPSRQSGKSRPNSLNRARAIRQTFHVKKESATSSGHSDRFGAGSSSSSASTPETSVFRYKKPVLSVRCSTIHEHAAGIKERYVVTTEKKRARCRGGADPTYVGLVRLDAGRIVDILWADPIESSSIDKPPSLTLGAILACLRERPQLLLQHLMFKSLLFQQPSVWSRAASA